MVMSISVGIVRSPARTKGALHLVDDHTRICRAVRGKSGGRQGKEFACEFRPGRARPWLVPAIHVFPAVPSATFQDVGGRDKPGQGEQKVVPVSPAPSYSCGRKLNRTAVGSSPA